MYSTLAYDREELAQVMRETYDELIEFVTTPEFRAVCEEMGAIPENERPLFVKLVLLNKAELKERGIVPPEGILIQRSTFGDRRPTLFCVKKYLPTKYHDAWENVNLTFDNTYDPDEVPRDGALAWRRPLPVEMQAQLMATANDIDIQELDSEYGVKTGAFGSRVVSNTPVSNSP